MLHRASVPCVEGPPDLFQLHCRQSADYPFLLQSVAGAGRYDILFAHPGQTLSADHPSFFDQLNRAAVAEKYDGAASDLPFIGGWFIYLGYEWAGQIEPAVRCPASPHRLPGALAVRCTAAIIYDHQRRSLELVAEDEAGLARLENDAAGLAGSTDAALQNLAEHCDEEPAQQFIKGVDRILDYLAQGDVFQVNLSRGWRARLKSGFSYQNVYRQLRRTNPAPFAGLLCWDGVAVLSSSPERLLEARDGLVQTRPIAGTHSRHADHALDDAQRARLLASFKERAEHIMLIDLERNDLGRVCEPGSIEVDELMQVESYAHVHHIVSSVRGRLRQSAGPGDVLRAVFPGGTITGCPKVRAMQIIAELEGVGRGPYTGAMGYLSRDGHMDMNILIRSMVCDGREISFRTGAGIVADSNPESELAETRAKARGMLLALGLENAR